jgi:type VI protein secretion system component VasK
MSFKDKVGAEGEAGGAGKFPDEAGELDEVLQNFRLSVHAWSEAAFSRPRAAVQPVRRKIWRLAAGSALGCVLVVGSVSGGVVYQHHVNAKKIAQVRMIEQQRLLAEQRNRQAQLEEEDLLAKVDSDVSREVPSAMEPLARLMAEDENQ